MAVIWLYFFDSKLISFTKNLKKSKRNEFEIVDILNQYLKKKKIIYNIFGRESTGYKDVSTRILNEKTNMIK